MSRAIHQEEQGPEETVGAVDTLKLYSEIWTGIRETDSNSFKLLGLVPLASGSGSGVLVSLYDALGAVSVVLLSLLGAVVTFGLYRWELRNIQMCSRLLKRAEWLERSFNMGDLAGREEAPRLFGRFPIGKRVAAEHHENAQRLRLSLTTQTPWFSRLSTTLPSTLQQLIG